LTATLNRQKQSTQRKNHMKNATIALTISCAMATMLLLTGCIAAIGNRDAQRARGVTLGQELVDLQKAKESGAITPDEYQAQRSKLLGNR